MFPGSRHLFHTAVYIYRDRCATVEWGLDGRPMDNVPMLVHFTDYLRVDKLGAQLASTELCARLRCVSDVARIVHFVDGCQRHGRCPSRVLNLIFISDADLIPHLLRLRHNLLRCRLHQQIY